MAGSRGWLSILPLVAGSLHGRRITAMTPFLVLLAVFVLAEIVAGVQIFRHDRPTAPAAQPPGLVRGRLPSTPYALRH